MDTVNSAISQEVGVAFDGVWLLLVHWNNVPTAANATEVYIGYQKIMVFMVSRGVEVRDHELQSLLSWYLRSKLDCGR